MKKVRFCLVFCMILTLLFGACGTAQTGIQPTSTPEATKAPEETAPAEGTEEITETPVPTEEVPEATEVPQPTEAPVVTETPIVTETPEVTDALKATANHRGTTLQIADVSDILHNIEESAELKTMWDKYRKQFSYAANIEYGQIMAVLKTLME